MSDALRTGSLGLDILLTGGWKRGTINEIWGVPGSGKTTLAEHAVWELETGRKALWLSMGTEVPHRPSWGFVGQPRNAEQAFFIMNTAVRGDVSLVVVDSANGLVRQRELDGDPAYVPHPQREYREELNDLKEGCQVHGAIVLFLSEPRDRDREPTRGTGISEKSRDRVRLRIALQHQSETRDVEASVHGKPAVDGGTAFTIRPGTGIDWADELARIAVRYELIRKNGNWYEVNYERFQGIRQLAGFITENTRLAIDLDEEIRAITGI